MRSLCNLKIVCCYYFVQGVFSFVIIGGMLNLATTFVWQVPVNRYFWLYEFNVLL